MFLTNQEMELLKGTKDVTPREQIVKARVMSVIRKYFRKYGFAPLQTPVIERKETLISKYAGGEEILKEIYSLKDQGKRDLALRFDLTVPLARFVTQNPNIKKPFKRYQIGQVFRDGPVKTGRFREFTQCDADVVGSKDLYTEAELLRLASDVFEELGLDYEIKINNRELLNEIMTKESVKDSESFILSLDKIDKIGREGVIKELKNKDFSEEQILNCLNWINKDLESLKFFESTKKLKELFYYLDKYGVKYVFSPSLARGLSYYTGTIYEVFLKNNDVKSSVAAGGRYDDMITNYSKRDNPAVGISFGLDAICSALPKEDKETLTDLFIISIDEFEEAMKVASELRKYFNVEVNLPSKNLKKGMEYCNSKKIPYAIIIGSEEVKKRKYTLRNMKTGKEQKLSLKELTQKKILNY